MPIGNRAAEPPRTTSEGRASEPELPLPAARGLSGRPEEAVDVAIVDETFVDNPHLLIGVHLALCTISTSTSIEHLGVRLRWQKSSTADEGVAFEGWQAMLLCSQGRCKPPDYPQSMTPNQIVTLSTHCHRQLTRLAEPQCERLTPLPRC